jgi:predicted kinase
MDLDYRRRPDLSDLFIGLYAPAIGDAELPLLLNFYKCYRACVRGKVESLLSLDAGVPTRKRAQARHRAQAYFRLAESYARKRSRQGLVMVSGPSGSGKSVLAGVMASRLGAVLLSTDMLRRQTFEERGRGAEIDTGVYSEQSRDQVYDEMLRRAEAFLAADRPIVFDGTFIEKRQRRPFIDLARETKRRLLVVECSAPDEVIRRRQQRREGEAWSTSEGRWEVYLAQKQRLEPADEVPADERVSIDTTRPLTAQLEVIEAKLFLQL